MTADSNINVFKHPLNEIFTDALDQVHFGKGAERHGTDPDFMKQPISLITDMTGLGGPLFQVIKKSHEAIYCLENGRFTPSQAYQEILGAIVYLALIARKLKDEQS